MGGAVMALGSAVMALGRPAAKSPRVVTDNTTAQRFSCMAQSNGEGIKFILLSSRRF